MKVEVAKDKFSHALSRVVRATAGRGASLPILSSVLIAAKGADMVLRATNLELGIEAKISVKVIEDGDIAVSGAMLSSFASQLSSGRTLSLQNTEGNLLLSSEKTKTTLKAIPHEDFPTLPYVAGESVKLRSSDIARGLRSVWYSASTSGIKPELGSVYVAAHDGALFFVATDSFRLAEKKISLKENVSFDPILIPLKNVGDILKLVEEKEGDVVVTFTKNQISFSWDNLYVTSRLIDGSFPDYKQIIPKSFATEATISREDLSHTLKLAHIFSDKFNQVNLSLIPSAKEVLISTKNPDVGETKNSIPAKISGEETTMNFNYRYLADCLGSIGGDGVTLSLSGGSRPLVIRGSGDPSFLYLVMPMNR